MGVCGDLENVPPYAYAICGGILSLTAMDLSLHLVFGFASGGLPASNPVQLEHVIETDAALLGYRQRTGTYWDAPDHERPKTRYFLGTVENIWDENGIPIGRPGANSRRYGVAVMSPKYIREEFGMREEQLCYFAAAHELGHLVGDGFTDYCAESASHTPNNYSTGEVCLMTWIGASDQGDRPIWGCNANEAAEFLNFNFCQKCKDQLKNFDFLNSSRPETKSSLAASSERKDR